jgi:hypothetical protein
MLTTDRVSGCALVVFALLVIWESRLLPLGTFRQPGPAYIPILLASLLLVCAVLLLITSRGAPSLSTISWTGWRQALAILAASSFAVFAIDRLGYRLTVLVLLTFLVKVLERRGWLETAVYAFALAFGSFYLFHTVLRVPLPLGPGGL